MADKLADKLDSYQNFVNREISWLEFNKRVLDEARDKINPLFERLKFLAITSSNLDEFFMIRVASLKDQVHANYTKLDPAGLTSKQQLEKISEKTHELVKRQYSTLNKSLMPLLTQNNICVKKFDLLTDKEKEFCNKYFMGTVYPVLTPMAWDSSRPFPLIANKSLNICALIRKKGNDECEFATVQVPSVLPRTFTLPNENSNNSDGESSYSMVLLEDIIINNIENLFTGYEVECAYCYRIMRNADLTIDEEDAQDLLREIEKQIKMRKWGEVIRLEVDANIDDELLTILKEEFDVGHQDIFSINGPIDLTFLFKVCSIDGFDELKYPPFSPQVPKDLENIEDESIFSVLQRKDIFLHHPYESFAPVVDFIKQAARDPNVLAIKQTLYRVSGNSPIVKYLAEAAENGKQVMVLVEVKARFDEENNIHWAKELERAGAHVIYGLLGLKTHCKITLVVRREENKICRYVHLGTGNYNDITAKLYTDMGLFTSNDEIGADASAVFNMLSGYCEPPTWNQLSLAPFWLRDSFEDLIESEIENAKNKRPAHIIMKVNSLVDPKIIKKLYKASNNGVKIELLVRGICGLKPGVQGISENITVHSIVGRFLEHSRIYYFENNSGNESLPKIFLSSADVMSRNLDRRVEIMFPINDEKIKNRIISILKIMFKDTVKTRIITQDGGYKQVERRGKHVFDSQEEFIAQACTFHKKGSKAIIAKRFDPINSQK